MPLIGRLPRPREATLRVLAWPDRSSPLDQALVLWFPEPRSYTGEDMVELHLHGGAVVVAEVCRALLALGCRPAEPGEFTRQALVNGKMDLLQAEGIADLIDAETSAQRQQALQQATGALSEVYEAWTTRLTRILAVQEAVLEFDEDAVPQAAAAEARDAAGALEAEIVRHIQAGRRAQKLRDGLRVVILGAPNAGKSSLLNALLERDVAIVSEIPGTTRDTLEHRLDLGGVPALLVDTAGVRSSSDPVEQEGIRRAWAAARDADILLVAIAADGLPPAELATVLKGREHAAVVLTKADLAQPGLSLGHHPVLHTSALSGEGLTGLRQFLAEQAEQLAGVSQVPVLTRERHQAALSEAVAALRWAAKSDIPEVTAEGYRSALLAMGRLTGRVDVEDVLGALFRSFCIGK